MSLLYLNFKIYQVNIHKETQMKIKIKATRVEHLIRNIIFNKKMIAHRSYKRKAEKLINVKYYIKIQRNKETK